jgi:hypothetical protein
MEQRAVIRFFILRGLKAREIQTELESVHGPEALALSTVKKWRKRFQEGRTHLIDDRRLGRPVTQDLAEAIQSMHTERPLILCKVLCGHVNKMVDPDNGLSHRNQTFFCVNCSFDPFWKFISGWCPRYVWRIVRIEPGLISCYRIFKVHWLLLPSMARRSLE